MKLVVVTPERQLLEADVEEVYAPGIAGQFGVLPLHVNFLTALVPGEVRYREHGVDHYLAIGGGLCEVVNDVVTILADSAEFAGDIDLQRAVAAEKRALEQIALVAAASVEYTELRAAADRAAARRQVAARG
ncbi:MAG TPA: ATP synthase F1 subunit epsilon [Candidatus Binatia bacterium]|nr:ATP synthase F1 subunit epsilon [Candidatus Binatia bacterium]